MTSGPITSWQIDGETMETVTDFIFLGSKITADGDCSHEIEKHLLLGRKVKLVIAFLPRSKRLLISWLQSPSAVIWEPPKIKSVTVSIVSPSICHELIGLGAMILVFEC